MSYSEDNARSWTNKSSIQEYFSKHIVKHFYIFEIIFSIVVQGKPHTKTFHISIHPRHQWNILGNFHTWQFLLRLLYKFLLSAKLKWYARPFWKFSREVNPDQTHSTDGSSFDESMKEVKFRGHCLKKRAAAHFSFRSRRDSLRHGINRWWRRSPRHGINRSFFC